MQEAATNAIKTGRAAEVSSTVCEDGGGAVAMVEDKGV